MAIEIIVPDKPEPILVEIGGGGVVGAGVNLTTTAAPDTVTIHSDTGTDAVIPVPDGTNAGVFLAAEKIKLAGIAAGATATAIVDTVENGNMAAVSSNAVFDALAGKQPLDANIVSIPTPADGDMIQRVGSSWVKRSIAQIKTALGLGQDAYESTLPTRVTISNTDAALNGNYDRSNLHSPPNNAVFWLAGTNGYYQLKANSLESKWEIWQANIKHFTAPLYDAAGRVVRPQDVPTWTSLLGYALPTVTGGFAGNEITRTAIATADAVISMDGAAEFALNDGLALKRGSLDQLWTWFATAKLDTLTKLNTLLGVGDPGITLARTDAGQTFAGEQTFSSRPTSSGSGLPSANSLVTRKDAEDAEIFNLHRIRRSFVSIGVANGGSATVSISDGDVVASSTAANNRPFVYAYRVVNTNSPASNQGHYVVPIRVASLMQIQHPGAVNTGGKIRFIYGSPIASMPAGDANALSSNGFGWEIFWDGSNIKIGLFLYNGSYLTTDGISGRSSPVSTGLTVGVTDSFGSIIVGLDSSGLVSLWASFANIGTALARPSNTPILTLAGGPTAGSRYSATGYPSWAAVNHSTNAASSQVDFKLMNKLITLD